MSRQFDWNAKRWIRRPDTKRQYNEALFTEVADRYGIVTRVLSVGRDASWKRQLVVNLPLMSSPRCLDIACGTGDITFMLARRYMDGHVIGMDICDAMLDIAERSNSYQNVAFRNGDMCGTGIDSESMDLVTGGYALRNAPSLEGALDEVRRILRPGGTASFLDFSKPPSPSLQCVEYGLLFVWGSLWGWLLHGHPEVYAYIARSLRAYPDRHALRNLLVSRGFVDIRSRAFYAGMLELLTFRKPRN